MTFLNITKFMFNVKIIDCSQNSTNIVPNSIRALSLMDDVPKNYIVVPKATEQNGKKLKWLNAIVVALNSN